MALPGWVTDYSGMTALAAIGSLARGRQWSDPVTGRFLWMRFISEFATAIGLAVVVVSWGTWAHVEMPVLCGICVGAGWLGPEPVANFILNKLGAGK